jgi:diguanylate cyclase (GGDEF)-like protein
MSEMRTILSLRIPDPGRGVDPALIARVIGILFVCGAVLVGVSLALPHPSSADVAGFVALIGGAGVVGVLFLANSERANLGAVHAAIALGTAMICLCIYFSGVATGVYALMFVWVVQLTAYFFPGPRALAHLAWILVAYAVTLAIVPPGPGYSVVTLWLLTSFTLGIIFWLARGLRREFAARRRLADALRHQADHDALTGLPNRRRLEDDLVRELARSRRSGSPLCVCALDLDGFKAVNDSRGHAAGDDALRTLAEEWRQNLRGSDVLARQGGDEFLLVLPDCSEARATEVAERLRETTVEGITCSIGIAEARSGDGLQTLLARADQALYGVKQLGGNAVATIAVEGEPPRLGAR